MSTGLRDLDRCMALMPRPLLDVIADPATWDRTEIIGQTVPWPIMTAAHTVRPRLADKHGRLTRHGRRLRDHLHENQWTPGHEEGWSPIEVLTWAQEHGGAS